MTNASGRDFDDARVQLCELPDLTFDPLFTPFSKEEVCMLLGFTSDGLEHLYDLSILERTVLKYELERIGISFSGFWDIIQARLSLSLINVGYSVVAANDLATEVTAEIAQIHDCASLSEIDAVSMITLFSDTLIQRSKGVTCVPHSYASIAEKMMIDLVHTAHSTIRQYGTVARAIADSERLSINGTYLEVTFDAEQLPGASPLRTP